MDAFASLVGGVNFAVAVGGTGKWKIEVLDERPPVVLTYLGAVVFVAYIPIVPFDTPVPKLGLDPVGAGPGLDIKPLLVGKMPDSRESSEPAFNMNNILDL